MVLKLLNYREGELLLLRITGGHSAKHLVLKTEASNQDYGQNVHEADSMPDESTPDRRITWEHCTFEVRIHTFDYFFFNVKKPRFCFGSLFSLSSLAGRV